MIGSASPLDGIFLAQQRHGLAVGRGEKPGGGQQQAAARAVHMWNSSRKLDARIAVQ
jgi:hypothetical protein